VTLSAGGVVLDELRAEDVRRHQIGRELDAAELQVHRVGERLDEQRLREAGNAAKKAVSAGEEAGENLAADALLADDCASHFGVEARHQIRGLLEWQDRRARASV
jgi:hypothetical protein